MWSLAFRRTEGGGVDRAPAPATRRVAAPAGRPDLRPAPTPEPLLRRLFGDALRRERTAQGRTLQDVATDARISIAYLSEIERGRKEASSEVLVAVCRALGLRLVDLLAESTATLVTAELESELRRRPEARRVPGQVVDVRSTHERTQDSGPIAHLRSLPDAGRVPGPVVDLRSLPDAGRVPGPVVDLRSLPDAGRVPGQVVDLRSTHERTQDNGPVAHLRAAA
jgi:transcriptional regulator with XRE-family HTH domain